MQNIGLYKDLTKFQYDIKIHFKSLDVTMKTNYAKFQEISLFGFRPKMKNVFAIFLWDFLYFQSVVFSYGVYTILKVRGPAPHMEPPQNFT